MQFDVRNTWAAAKTSMMKLHKGLVLELCLRKLNPAERKLAEAVAEESSRQDDAEAMRKQDLRSYCKCAHCTYILASISRNEDDMF